MDAIKEAAIQTGREKNPGVLPSPNFNADVADVGSSVRSSAQICGNLPTEYLESRWYAAYTSANHEKRVAIQLGERAVEHFLPQYESVRRWKDRRKKLQLPLFPGYVFVRLALRDRLKVLQVPGVARLVGFGGVPCALPEAEIEAVRTCLARKAGLEPHPYVQVGRRVRVTAGALAGIEGRVIRRKNRSKFVISLDLIQRSVAVEVEALEVEPAAEKEGRSAPFGVNE